MTNINPFSKEAEEEERRYIPPDYTEAAKKSGVEEDDDDEDIDLDDDDDDDDLDDDDDIEDDDDPAEDEEVLEIREKLNEVNDLPFSSSPTQPQQSSPKPFFQQQTVAKPMSTPWQPAGSSTPWSGQSTQQSTPWGGNTASTPGWGRPTNSGSTPWGSQTPSWGNAAGNNRVELNRNKRIIFCDVLDCLICTQDGPNRVGLIPRDIWDMLLRLDVFSALRRYSEIERIYAMIPRNLIPNSTDGDNWKSMLDYIARALASYLRIPSEAVQILTQSFIAQPKEEMVRSVLKGVDIDEVVYIGTQSAGPGQSSVDIDCARNLNIDYIDLTNFLMSYS